MGWSLSQKTYDPVCGKRFRASSSDVVSIYNGHAFYFCSQQCRTAFQAAPSAYAGAPPPKVKGWWSRYLKRVEKTTGSKPPCCH